METYFDYLWNHPKLKWQVAWNRSKQLAVFEDKSKRLPEAQLERQIRTAKVQWDVMDSGRVYKIASEFEDILSSADLGVPPKHLINEQVAGWSYVHLSNDYSIDELGHSINHFWYRVWLTTENTWYLSIASFIRKDGEYTENFPMFNICLGDEKTIQDIVEEQLRVAKEIAGANNGQLGLYLHIPLLCKFILYINSGDPDLRWMRAPNKGKYERTWKKGNDISVFDYQIVGFSWKKSVLYTKDQTIVKAHLRWQPCGVGRTQIKLVVVREHTRTYKVEQAKGDVSNGKDEQFESAD